MANPTDKPHGKRRLRALMRRRKDRPGQAPGMVVPSADAVKPQISVMSYGEGRITCEPITEVAELRKWLRDDGVTWIDVQGLGDAVVLDELAQLIGMHRLGLEDVVNLHQRPKVEDYGDHLFIVARMVDPDRVDSEQLAMFVRPHLIATFQERPGDCFDLVRARIREAKGKIRNELADYLAYALLDALVDAYFPVLEKLGERIEALEESVGGPPREDMIREIHDMRRDLMLLRRLAWPTREMLSALLRDTTPMITAKTRLYLRDCYDHSIHLMDIVENYREIAAGLMDVYLSSLSNRLNEIMKLLTLISTIFIPLTFIVGVYGMNFDTTWPLNMPELRSPYGYVGCIAFMALVAGGLLLWFKRRGWIGRGREQN